MLDPFLVIANAMPKIAFVPIFYIWLGSEYSVYGMAVDISLFISIMVVYEGFQGTNPNKIKLEWKQKGSDAYFDGFSLSDGTLRFICLAVLLLQPSLPSLILLDEPELGLHPFAITILSEMIEAAARRSQVILATQSVTLLNQFSPEAIIIADNDGLRTHFRRMTEQDLSSWMNDYSVGDLWEKNIIGGRP